MHKSERLCRENLIASLFTAGHRFFSQPLQVVWMPAQLEEPVPAQCMFSVSARKFPHATDRNRIKRLLKEAYRRNKSPLYDVIQASGKQYAIALIYTGKTLTDFNSLEPKIQVALKALANKIGEQTNTDGEPAA